MYELHENEQYFFDPPTIAVLADALVPYTNVCCLCAPLLGSELARRGRPVTILDVDERFAGTPGFQRFDLFRPHFIKTEFDIILCDPPFFNASLSQLFAAVRLLAHQDMSQKLAVTYLARRESAILGTFGRFNLRPTGFFPQYRTLQKRPKNLIQLYSNIEADWLPTAS